MSKELNITLRESSSLTTRPGFRLYANIKRKNNQTWITKYFLCLFCSLIAAYNDYSIHKISLEAKNIF